MKKSALGLVLFLALAHGMIFIFLIPPWQHYDEPSHFEYVRLLASKGEIPDVNALDLEFRHQLVQSMIVNGFFRGVAIPAPETIEAGTQVYGLEYSQLDEPPVYYFLASLPVSFLLKRSPAVQLMSARAVSLGLFLMTVVAVWGITIESTQPNSSLRLWVPLSAALLPGFVDLMTAVNNDVGAVTAFSFFLWGSLRFLNKQVSAGTIFGVLGSAIICAGMKSSALIAIPLSVVVLVFGLAQGKRQIWVWLGLVLLGLVGLFGILTWQDAAYWHRGTSQQIPTRVKTEMAPLGDFALQIDTTAPSTPTWQRPLQQPLNPPRNAELTLGVWMWVSGNPEEPVEIRAPILSTEKSVSFETVTVGSVPKFFSFETSLPLDTHRLWLTLAPALQSADRVVYYDGFVLAEGKYPLGEPPIFDDVKGLSGTWGGARFQNLVRNPSAESVWPALRPTIDNRLSALIPDNARGSMLLFGVMDWPQTGWYFHATANNLMETFWGRFGWGHIPLIPPEWYKFLEFLSAIGWVGFGIGLVRRIRYWDKKLFFLTLVMGLIWGAAILRGEIFIFTSSVFFPSARYAYPAIGPTLLILMTGWRECGRLFLRLAPSPSIDQRLIANIILGLFFLVLDMTSFYSILVYYERI